MLKRFKTNLMGFISLFCTGLGLGLLYDSSIPNGVLYFIIGFNAVVYLLTTTRDGQQKHISGELILLPGDEEDKITVGLGLVDDANTLMTSKEITLKVTNTITPSSKS